MDAGILMPSPSLRSILSSPSGSVATADISGQVIERLQHDRPVAVQRLGYAPVTCPPTPVLEELYYPNARTIASTAYDLVKGGKNDWLPQERKDLAEFEFRGPF